MQCVNKNKFGVLAFKPMQVVRVIKTKRRIAKHANADALFVCALPFVPLVRFVRFVVGAFCHTRLAILQNGVNVHFAGDARAYAFNHIFHRC